MDTMTIFVYGTLKRGYRADLSSRGEYKKDATLNDYSIHNLGSFPGIVPNPGHVVQGEVFVIDKKWLSSIDSYEGVSFGLYRRETVTLSCGTKVDTYIYNNQQHISSLEPIESGRWE